MTVWTKHTLICNHEQQYKNTPHSLLFKECINTKSICLSKWAMVSIVHMIPMDQPRLHMRPFAALFKLWVYLEDLAYLNKAPVRKSFSCPVDIGEGNPTGFNKCLIVLYFFQILPEVLNNSMYIKREKKVFNTRILFVQKKKKSQHWGERFESSFQSVFITVLYSNPLTKWAMSQLVSDERGPIISTPSGVTIAISYLL